MFERIATRVARRNNWALVLAAGEGSRLRNMTTTSAGISIPKQFCSLTGQHSLLDSTLTRARALVEADRVCTVVAAQHRGWWEQALAASPADNVIVQQSNRGTANGVLLPLLHILDRDPDANIIVLPSDHYIEHEHVLHAASVHALASFEKSASDAIVLLGVRPETADQELGYIVPVNRRSDSFADVACFVEKPCASEARMLVSQGALWNVFILVARAQSLLRIYEAHCGDLVQNMRSIVRRHRAGIIDDRTYLELYETLPSLDFSRDLAAVRPDLLRVFEVPPCGWSDLGTPQRVQQVLGRFAHQPIRVLSSTPTLLNLSNRCTNVSA